MIIGFDAKRAFHNFTGLGNYSRTLIDTLAHFYPENSYCLFTPKINVSDKRVSTFLSGKNLKLTTPDFPFNNMPALWRSFFINQDIYNSDIDIFHGLSQELPIGLSKKIKQVVTVHDLIQMRYPEDYNIIDKEIFNLKVKQACQQADIIVAISEQTKIDIVNFLKIDAEKIRVIYQSADRQWTNLESKTLDVEKTPKNSFSNSNTLTILSKYNLPENYVLHVGTINARKNLLTLIKAIEQLKNSPDEINLVAVGNGGAYFETVKKYIAEKKLEKVVYLCPKVDFSDLPTIYRNAKIFIYPSFFEGFGIPILEALLSEVPVITSEGGCFKEVGGENSIYINPNKAEDISIAIKKIMSDTALRNKMILSGRDFSENFRADNIGAKWIELYGELIKK